MPFGTCDIISVLIRGAFYRDILNSNWTYSFYLIVGGSFPEWHQLLEPSSAWDSPHWSKECPILLSLSLFLLVDIWLAPQRSEDSTCLLVNGGCPIWNIESINGIKKRVWIDYIILFYVASLVSSPATTFQHATLKAGNIWIERAAKTCEYPAGNARLLLVSYCVIPLSTASNRSFPVRSKTKNHGVASTLRVFEPSAPRLQLPGSRSATNLVHRQNTIVSFRSRSLSPTRPGHDWAVTTCNYQNC